MLSARALLAAPQPMTAAAESFLLKEAGLCSRILREYLVFWLMRVSRWQIKPLAGLPGQLQGAAAGSRYRREQVPALGREAA